MSKPVEETGAFEITEREVLHSWGTGALERLQLRSPDARVTERFVIKSPGAVSIVPLMDDGNTVVMVRQYRAAIGKYLLELPAGTRDVEGEPAETTAQRELREEAGLVARTFTELCDFYSSPGSSDHHHHLFLAQGLETVEREAHGVEEEYMTVERVRLSEIPQLIASGVVADAKTIIGLLLARDRIASNL